MEWALLSLFGEVYQKGSRLLLWRRKPNGWSGTQLRRQINDGKPLSLALIEIRNLLSVFLGEFLLDVHSTLRLPPNLKAVTRPVLRRESAVTFRICRWEAMATHRIGFNLFRAVWF